MEDQDESQENSRQDQIERETKEVQKDEIINMDINKKVEIEQEHKLSIREKDISNKLKSILSGKLDNKKIDHRIKARRILQNIINETIHNKREYQDKENKNKEYGIKQQEKLRIRNEDKENRIQKTQMQKKQNKNLKNENGV